MSCYIAISISTKIGLVRYRVFLFFFVFVIGTCVVLVLLSVAN